MREQNNEVIEIDLLRLLRALWDRVWLILLAGLAAAAISFSYAKFLIEPRYEASILMYVNNSSFTVGSTSFSINSSEISAAQSLVDTYIVIMESRTTLEDVIKRADVDYSYETLRSMIKASAVNGTEIFRVTVNSTDPEEAALLANTISKVLPNTISDVVDGSSVRIVDRAVVPTQKVSPSITKYTAIGFALGFLLCCVVVALIDMFDDAIRDADYLTQTFDAPVLASVPDLMGGSSANYNYNYKYKYDYKYNYNYYAHKKQKSEREDA